MVYGHSVVRVRVSYIRGVTYSIEPLDSRPHRPRVGVESQR